VLVKGPAQAEAFHDPEEPLPARAAELDPDRNGVYTHDGADAYARRPGAFFRARDLGAAAGSGGRIGANVYVADDPATGGDWHAHSSTQWIYVLAGETDLALDGGSHERRRTGDAVLIPARTRHAQGEITAGYAQLSLMLPAAFETVHG
jgi:quercetin dioxygenase-like cupin family protein